jgi:hypothetical protein
MKRAIFFLILGAVAVLIAGTVRDLNLAFGG